MHLNKTERWILYNQYRILELLEPDQADAHRLAQEAIQSGFETELTRLSELIYAETFSDADCREVMDILGMYASMQASYDRLDDKNGLTARDVEFPGFDGNDDHEGTARSFVEHLRKKQLFEHVRVAGDLNSHRLMLPRYRAQLAAWRRCADQDALSVDEIKAIQGARNAN